MIAGTDIDDLDAQLAAAYRADREVADMGKPSVRRAREKQHALSPDDGRRKRKTGRTAQFNVKMKPDLKRQIVNASRDQGIAISALAEQAFVALLAKLARQAQP
jgi:predicted HicB family RNase H-like nuclease